MNIQLQQLVTGLTEEQMVVLYAAYALKLRKKGALNENTTRQQITTMANTLNAEVVIDLPACETALLAWKSSISEFNGTNEASVKDLFITATQKVNNGKDLTPIDVVDFFGISKHLFLVTVAVSNNFKLFRDIYFSLKV